jgi:hypothetical protein
MIRGSEIRKEIAAHGERRAIEPNSGQVSRSGTVIALSPRERSRRGASSGCGEGVADQQRFGNGCAAWNSPAQRKQGEAGSCGSNGSDGGFGTATEAAGRER